MGADVRQYTYVGNNPLNLVDPLGLYEIEVDILTDKTITVDISDSLSGEQQSLAEAQIKGSAELLHGLDAGGQLSGESRSAVEALQALSVSGDKSGLNTANNNFNFKISELISNQRIENSTPGAGVILTASQIVHDGRHAVQNLAGALPIQEYNRQAALNNAGHGFSQSAIDNVTFTSDRDSDRVQSNFSATVPGLSAANRAKFSPNRTNAEILRDRDRP